MRRAAPACRSAGPRRRFLPPAPRSLLINYYAIRITSGLALRAAHRKRQLPSPRASNRHSPAAFSSNRAGMANVRCVRGARGEFGFDWFFFADLLLCCCERQKERVMSRAQLGQKPRVAQRAHDRGTCLGPPFFLLKQPFPPSLSRPLCCAPFF